MFFNKKAKVIVRPTIFSIFLAFNILQLGIFLVAKSSFDLANNNQIQNFIYSLTQFDTSKNEQEYLEIQKQIEISITAIQEEFSSSQLLQEMNQAYLLRKTKIHYFIAMISGLCLMFIGILTIAIFVRSWNCSWKKLKFLDPKDEIRYKISTTSHFICWFTFLLGLFLLLLSIITLRELTYYRDIAWITGYLNYDAMTNLADHYKTILVLGIIYFICGLVSIYFQFKTSTK